MRRLQALDPATFLIDQHRRILAADTFAQRPDEGTQLVGLLAVAPEENESERI